MAFLLMASRCILVCVFLRSGLGKIASLSDFRVAVANYQLLPQPLVPVVAASLPFAEVAAAILLAAGVLSVGVAGVLALLLVTFALAIGISLARGRTFDCGCSGAAPRTISWTHVASNSVLAGLAIALALAPPTAFAVWPGVAGLFSVTTPRADALPVVLTVVLCLVMVTLLRRAAVIRGLWGTLRRQDGAVVASAAWERD